MKRIVLLLALTLAATGPAQAQFRLDINRIIDTAKSAQRAAGDVSEKDEIEIGRELASTLLGAGTAHAQFRFDINRLIDTARSAQRATGEIDEKDEIGIGRDMAAT